MPNWTRDDGSSAYEGNIEAEQHPEPARTNRSEFDRLRKLLTPDEDTRPVERQLDTCEVHYGCPSRICGLPCTRWWISTGDWNPNHGVAPFGVCSSTSPEPYNKPNWHEPWRSQIEAKDLVEVTKEEAQAEVLRMREAKLFRGQ